MKFELSRPLVILDLETTGLWIEKDRIIEIACLRVEPDGAHTQYVKKVNPGMPIPEIVTELTGISDSDVKDAPKFKEIAGEVNTFIGHADVAGFNVEVFDLPVLERELFEAGFKFEWKSRKIFDAQKVFHYHEKRDLSAAYKFYCAKDLENAHSALGDADATFEILRAQLERYGNGETSFDVLSQFKVEWHNPFYDDERRLRWWNNELYPMFGKYSRRYSLNEIAKKDPKYLRWVLTSDFSPEVKEKVQEALEKVGAAY